MVKCNQLSIFSLILVIRPCIYTYTTKQSPLALGFLACPCYVSFVFAPIFLLIRQSAIWRQKCTRNCLFRSISRPAHWRIEFVRFASLYVPPLCSSFTATSATIHAWSPSFSSSSCRQSTRCCWHFGAIRYSSGCRTADATSVRLTVKGAALVEYQRLQHDLCIVV